MRKKDERDSNGIGGVSGDNVKKPINFYSRNSALCYHVGVLIFSSEINEFHNSNYVTNELAKQFIVAVLLGAHNIEQTKLLDFEALKAMLGLATKNLFMQRCQLSQMATKEGIMGLYMFNSHLISANEYTDFYYDPHVKNYTGAEKILKGWCPKIRSANKIINMDFIHTAPDGHPVYMENNDNFNDMRERFLIQIKSFRKIVFGNDDDDDEEEEKILTFVVDRGIFSFELFETIVKDNQTHIITWEKGYKKEQWDEGKVVGKFSLYRRRNNSHDLLKYDFDYIDQEWEKQSEIRQFIVRATNPKGNQIEVSVLSDDKERKGEEILGLIFRRWVQENDFKYEDKHFGINEITSYSVCLYKKLESLIKDKQTRRGEYKALEHERRNLNNKLKALLFKQQYVLKNKKKIEEAQEQIQKLTETREMITKKLEETKKEGSKLEEMIGNEYKRLDTDNKSYMDGIKIIARNIFYKCFQRFKKKYDNYRDDHVIFRHLTQSHGLVSFEDEQVTAVLFPTAHYPPKLRKIIDEVLEEINDAKPQMPDGSGRQVTLKLGVKNENGLFDINKTKKNDRKSTD